MMWLFGVAVLVLGGWLGWTVWQLVKESQEAGL